MKLLAIDPGAKPGYALLDLSRLVDRKLSNKIIPLPAVLQLATAWDALPQHRYDVVVVEGQWLFSLAHRAAIATLGITAGAQLYRAHAAAPAAALHVMPVVSDKRRRLIGWREALGMAGVAKAVAQNRAKAALTPAERRLLQGPKSRMSDALDAILIGWGWAQKPTRKWKIPC